MTDKFSAQVDAIGYAIRECERIWIGLDAMPYCLSVGTDEFIPLPVLEHMVRCQISAAAQLRLDVQLLADAGFLPAIRYLAGLTGKGGAP